MIRKVAGTLLVLHGLAHALPGIRVTDPTLWDSAGSGVLLRLATLLWALAAAGFLAAGLGLLGAAPFRERFRPAGWIGVAGSAGLLLLLWPTWWSIPALAIDAAVALALYRTRYAVEWPPTREDESRRHRALRRAGAAASLAFVAYVTLLVLARPLHVRWGSTGDELRGPLPGDEYALNPTYQVQHAVTIRATPEEIWPWLAQIGHDRGGFYSYTWLENSFGLHVRNADRVHPEWQGLVTGDSVFATPRDYLGTGRRFGWRVQYAEPYRVLILENWGSFVLEPVDSATTRLIVRTRGEGRDDLAAFALSPISMLTLEPAHFIMERRMLLTIRDRVESAQRAGRRRS
ncbi:MAG TPA: hypothetical protein VEQ60_27400 [Longimicrobium sp.]|nr:hypothetical protein [Longimicrobium sp.]